MNHQIGGVLLILGTYVAIIIFAAIPRRKGQCGHCGKELWSIYPHGTLEHKTRSGQYTWQCEDGHWAFRREDIEVV